EEAVAGMTRVGARLFRGAIVLLGEEIARDLDGLLGGARVQRASVVGSDDRDGGDPELATRAEDAQRNLAAVRDEQLLDHAFLPGLRRPLGSNARFTAECSSNARGPSCRSSQLRLTNPTPCSPEIVPPSRRASSNRPSDARSTRASSRSA